MKELAVKKIILFFITVILSDYSTLKVVEAGTYQTVNAMVASLRIDQTATYVELPPAPPACEGGHNYDAHLILYKIRPNFNELYSLLLTLYSTNREIYSTNREILGI